MSDKSIITITSFCSPFHDVYDRVVSEFEEPAPKLRLPQHTSAAVGLLPHHDGVEFLEGVLGHGGGHLVKLQGPLLHGREIVAVQLGVVLKIDKKETYYQKFIYNLHVIIIVIFFFYYFHYVAAEGDNNLWLLLLLLLLLPSFIWKLYVLQKIYRWFSYFYGEEFVGDSEIVCVVDDVTLCPPLSMCSQGWRQAAQTPLLSHLVSINIKVDVKCHASFTAADLTHACDWSGEVWNFASHSPFCRHWLVRWCGWNFGDAKSHASSPNAEITLGCDWSEVVRKFGRHAPFRRFRLRYIECHASLSVCDVVDGRAWPIVVRRFRRPRPLAAENCRRCSCWYLSIPMTRPRHHLNGLERARAEIEIHATVLFCISRKVKYITKFSLIGMS